MASASRSATSTRSPCTHQATLRPV
jgi:hypothetical protein